MKPLNNKIKLDIKEITRMGQSTGAIEENGIIIALGDEVGNIHLDNDMQMIKKYKIGDKLYFKTWAIDIITVGEEKHYFISADSDAICAISD